MEVMRVDVFFICKKILYYDIKNLDKRMMYVY